LLLSVIFFLIFDRTECDKLCDFEGVSQYDCKHKVGHCLNLKFTASHRRKTRGVGGGGGVMGCQNTPSAEVYYKTCISEYSK